MDASNVSLLFAIAAPVSALLALNVWLALNGERGTLLLPARGAFESTSCMACVLGAIASAQGRARTARLINRLEAANDACEREAA